ncbi:hypothetical protein Vretimale_6154 [Volvox reticuliferus]|uniref:Uncharacterized protein n=1 Tax=Volvox reticuliferus TaxID=1737510 RepID=A0A8J4CAE6_9CHLO|nr:hypothetical protein Vretifemale_8072 [Volvox reticuliferus]GIM01438.1 hypothetical protein Vretimale_6154 [Volvox reticuliferus]
MSSSPETTLLHISEHPAHVHVTIPSRSPKLISQLAFHHAPVRSNVMVLEPLTQPLLAPRPFPPPPAPPPLKELRGPAKRAPIADDDDNGGSLTSPLHPEPSQPQPLSAAPTCRGDV